MRLRRGTIYFEQEVTIDADVEIDVSEVASIVPLEEMLTHYDKDEVHNLLGISPKKLCFNSIIDSMKQSVINENWYKFTEEEFIEWINDKK